MEYLSDMLLGAGALAAAFYCVVLSQKLGRLSGLDQELGTAIAVLSQQVDELTGVLQSAQSAADSARDELVQVTERAQEVATQLQGAAAPPPVETQPVQVAQPQVVETQPVEMPRDSGGLQEGAPSLFVRHSAAVS